MTSAEPGNDKSRKHKFSKDTNFLIIASVTLIAVLGVSSITPAFPEIEKVLKISAQQVGLLITVFTLPGVLLTPVLGIFADRFGRKKILVPSLFLFAAAGTLCGITTNFNVLLIFRFLQGVGAASLGSLNVTILGDLYSGKQRTVAMGYNSSILSVGTASYPAVGGALAVAGWNFPFFLPLLALPVGLLVIFKLKNPEPRSEGSLKEYLSSAWNGIKDRRIIGIFIASVLTFIILYGSYLTFFPFHLSDKFDSSSLVIGLMMSVMSFTTAITSAQLGKITKIISEKSLLKTAFILYAASLVIIPFMPSIWLLILPIIIYGVAQGINIPSIYTLLAGYAPMEHRGAFMSLNGMVLRLGQTLGPLIMGFVYGISGIAGTFYAGAIVAVIAFFILIIMVK